VLPYFPLPGTSTNKTGQVTTSHPAFVFSPLVSGRIISERSSIAKGGGTDARVSVLEGVVRGSTSGAALLSTGNGGYDTAIVLDEAAQVVYAVAGTMLYKFNAADATMIGAPVGLPVNNMGPSRQYRRLILEPGSMTALALDSDPNNPAVRRIDLATGAVTDVTTTSCLPTSRAKPTGTF